MAHDPSYVCRYCMKACCQRHGEQVRGVNRAHSPCPVQRVRPVLRPVIFVSQCGNNGYTHRPCRYPACQVREQQCSMKQVRPLRTNDISQPKCPTQWITLSHSYTRYSKRTEAVFEGSVIGLEW